MDTTITRARRMYSEIEEAAQKVFYGLGFDPDTIFLERAKKSRNNRVTFDLIIGDTVATEAKTTDEIMNFLEGVEVAKQGAVINKLMPSSVLQEPEEVEEDEAQPEPEPEPEPRKVEEPVRQKMNQVRERHNAAVAARRSSPAAAPSPVTRRRKMVPDKREQTSFMDRFRNK